MTICGSCQAPPHSVCCRVANDGPTQDLRFSDPKARRYGVPTSDPGYVKPGFWLRRLIKDHKTPAVRLPRLMVRNLAWHKGDLLSVVQVEGAIVIAKLQYTDPQEVSHDQVDEARRK